MAAARVILLAVQATHVARSWCGRDALRLRQLRRRRRRALDRLCRLGLYSLVGRRRGCCQSTRISTGGSISTSRTKKANRGASGIGLLRAHMAGGHGAEAQQDERVGEQRSPEDERGPGGGGEERRPREPERRRG